MSRDVSFSTVASIVVASLVTLAIVGALIYLATFHGDHDAKLALIAMVSASSGTAVSLVVLNRPKPSTPPPAASTEDFARNTRCSQQEEASMASAGSERPG